MRSAIWQVRATCVAVAVLCACAGLAGAQSLTPAADSALHRRITITAKRALITELFSRLRHEFAVSMAWSGDAVPERRVSINVRDATIGDVLAAILADTDLEYVTTKFGTIVIVGRRPSPQADPSRAPPTEARSVEQSLSATGVRQLDAVVVIGSPVAAIPERELPTAIGIVRPSALAPGTYANVADIIREHLPGVILWDRGFVGPPAPVAALRGISSFTTRAVKTYVDGIELASPELFTLLDARSIDRIELIRGPQGAALYGPDALNGILRIETRHGRVSPSGLHARGVASAGSLHRADLKSAELVQDYSLGVSGSGGLSTFDVGGAFAQTRIGGEFPRMRMWSIGGGARTVVGRFTLETSARVGRREYAVDSVNRASQVVPGARQPRALEERGVAATLVHTPSDRVKQTIIAGYQRSEGVREPFHSPLLAPTLQLGATDETASRVSLRYSASVDVSSAFTIAGGAEYSQRTIERVGRGETNLYQRFRDLRSTGAFAQMRARVGSRLVLSGGVRGEDATSVDAHNGPLWASTAGATWSREWRYATVRLRGAWGNGIRPPEPGMNKDASRGNPAVLVQLANTDLVPERQRGVEGGADIFFRGGAFMKVTLYEQRALDLIQPVRRSRSADVTVYQFQNVGRVDNRGSEFEAGVNRGAFSTSVIAYFPRSTVVKLGRGYTGEFRVGDKLLEVPDAAGSMMVAYDWGRLRTEIGGSWIGSWIGYDRVLLASNAERVDVRSYWKTYDDVIRPFVTLSAGAAPYHAFLRIDNFGNSRDVVRDDLSPTLGRTVMLGIARQH